MMGDTRPKKPLKDRKVKKKPKDPKKYKGLPPGFRMRLGPYARPLTEVAIAAHDNLDSENPDRNLSIEVDQNNKPVKVDPNDNSGWPMYKRIPRGKLECSGLIFLFEKIPGDPTHVKFLRAEEPVVSEGDATDKRRKTLKEALDALAEAPNGATHYVVARYRIEPKFAVHYWDRFWNHDNVKTHLKIARDGIWVSPHKEIIGFKKRLENNRDKKKQHYRVIRPGGKG